MQRASKFRMTKPGFSSIILLGILVFLTIGVTYFISTSKETMGVVVTVGIIGVGLAFFSIVFPLFGLYVSLIASFFVFDILRFLNTDVQLVPAIDASVYLTFIGVLINKIIKKEPFWNNARNPILIVYGILVFYVILQFFNPNGGSKELYFLFIRRFTTLILFLYCSLQLLREYKTIKQFFFIWLVFAFIAGLYGCLEQWVGMPKYEVDFILSNPDGIGLITLDNGDYRKASILSGVTDFGITMAGTAGMVLVLFLNMKMNLITRGVIFFVLFVMVMGMSYSGTRTATIMLVMEICLYILMTITNKRTLLFSCFFMLFFGAILFAPSYGNPTLNRIKSAFEFTQDESLNVRDENRHVIQPYIHSHPIGGGVATTGVPNAKFNVGHPLAGFPTDSGLLTIVLEYGWIGLILQCLCYIMILQQGVKGFYRSQDPKFRILFLAATVCLFGYIVAQYSQTSIGQVPGGFLFYGLVAICISLYQLEYKKNKVPGI